MKISQPKRLKPAFSLPGKKGRRVTVTTLREKNKITGWDVNGKQFRPGKGTLLMCFKKMEKFVNTLL